MLEPRQSGLALAPILFLFSLSLSSMSVLPQAIIPCPTCLRWNLTPLTEDDGGTRTKKDPARLLITRKLLIKHPIGQKEQNLTS